jgi:2-(3-amino-3-carboxypropyl)histidine synthase
MDYELELGMVSEKIKESKTKRVCIQLPDGLKPYADTIQKELESLTKTTILIWGGSCFGACGPPSGLGKIKVGLLVQFGHSEMRY